jgi:hypothetical protein
MLAEHGTHVPPTSDCDLTVNPPLSGLKFAALKPPGIVGATQAAAACARVASIMLGT